MKSKVKLLKFQSEFVRDTTTKYLGLVTGYGGGKTHSLCVKAVHLASMNVGFRAALLEPTNVMVRDVLIPSMDQVLHDTGIRFEFRASPYPEYTLKFPTGSTTILLRSAENYRRLAGLNLAFYGVDEADTIEKDLATKMWRMLQSRLRTGLVRQGFTTSTPEGFGFLHEFFVTDSEGRNDRRLIQASSRDNPFLPIDFIESLLTTYPENLINAYIDGQFVNLTTGNVYYSFSRAENKTSKTLADFPTSIVHIGVDFNVGNTSAVVSVIDSGCIFAIDEITGAHNTEHLIELVKEKYGGRQVMIYPDSSGKSERTNAGVTDIIQFKKNGLETYYNTKNPLVKNRVGSVNAMIKNGVGLRRLFINTDRCKSLTKSLEQQGYDSSGSPDKSTGLDHIVDALGYFVWFRFPITQHATIKQY
jgi:hypothetical protein